MITIFTIEEMRVHVGLDPTDNSQDVEINASMEAAIAIAETYCDRKFQRMVDVETFTHVAGYSVQLHRFPLIVINSVAPIENSTVPPPYHADFPRGILYFDGRLVSHSLIVDYEGGYDDLTVPPDLRWALFRVFDVLWAESQGGSTVQPGTIKSARIADLQISYETGAAASAFAEGVLSLPVVAILDKYKRYSV